MAVFSTNQVRQLYVVKEYKSTGVVASDNAGAISVKTTDDKKFMYFDYMGAGGRTRSDLIQINHLSYAKATPADKMKHELARYKVTLSSLVNEGNPVIGQDYILRIAFRNYIGLSEEDQYFKYGMVHAYSGLTPSNFYKILAMSLVKNFSRETSTLLNFYLETGGTDPATEGTAVQVTAATKEADLTGTYTGVIIEEAPQEWILGVFPQAPVNFTVQFTTVIADGDAVIWGEVNKVASKNSISNGKEIADLEYFCMGERGDQYRNMGWPNVIRTTYLADPTLEYNVITLHYFTTEDGVHVQKSEKDIQLAIPTGVSATELINAINTAAGTELSLD